jgi:hypothetical protein
MELNADKNSHQIHALNPGGQLDEVKIPTYLIIYNMESLRISVTATLN